MRAFRFPRLWQDNVPGKVALSCKRVLPVCVGSFRNRFIRTPLPSALPNRGKRHLVAVLLCCMLGCAASQLRLGAPDEVHRLESGQLILEAPFPLSRSHPLVQQLRGVCQEVYSTLQLPPGSEPIQVRLFSSQEELDAYRRLRFPGAPARRAFFVEEKGQLRVFAAWGPRVAEDLRHEVVHGCLHSVVPGLPLWLDEGLAEYFEVATFAGRDNPAHRRLLLDRMSLGWQPDLARLERLDSPGRMTQQDYAECWAWVHFLLHTTAERKTLLRQYLHHCRTGAEPGALGQLWARQEPPPRVQSELRLHLIRLASLAAKP